MLNPCCAIVSRRVSLTLQTPRRFWGVHPKVGGLEHEPLPGGAGFLGWVMCVRACLEDERADSSFDHEILIHVNGNYFEV